MARIGGWLICDGANLHSDSGAALHADGLQVGQGMHLRRVLIDELSHTRATSFSRAPCGCGSRRRRFVSKNLFGFFERIRFRQVFEVGQAEDFQEVPRGAIEHAIVGIQQPCRMRAFTGKVAKVPQHTKIAPALS